MYGKFSSRLFFPLLLGLCIFLVFNRHSRSKFNDYHSVNWADAGGYYVYLPSLFIYDFNAHAFPDSIDHKSGDGFHLDHQTGKVLTKYNYGVSLLQLPFFLSAHVITLLTDGNASGYQPVYYRAIMIGGVIYLIAGLYLVRKILRRKGLSEKLSDLLIIILLCSTNLYYYGINSPGFSHVYSFFLFAWFIWLTGECHRDQNNRTLALIAFVFATAVLVRVTNVFILIYFILYGQRTLNMMVHHLVRPKVILYFLLAFVFMFLPQLIYWKYASGDLVSDMYGNEGFNFTDPKVAEILFSPYNGLLPYTPVVLLLIIITCYLAVKKDTEAAAVTLIFFVALYFFSSWYSWTFGCSYGSRPFSEYMAFLILPFGYWISATGKTVKTVILALCVILSIFNINTIYHYDGCWYGGIWDWTEYLRIILR